MENYSRSKYSLDSQEVFEVDAPDGYPYGDDDDGSFFELDLTLPLYYDGPLKDNTSPEDSEEEEFEFNFSISSTNQPNPNESISTADNLFYKGQLLPLQVPPSVDMVKKHEVCDGKGYMQSQCGNVNGIRTQFPALLRTATKLKISLFGLKKSAKVGMDLQASCTEHGCGMDSPVKKQSKFFTVKFKVVDVPLVSLFTRDNSRGSKRDENNNDFQKKTEDSDGDIGPSRNNDRDKKRAKDIVQKYVKMIKPLYVKISQRSNEKTKLSDLEKSGVTSGARNSGFSGSGTNQSQLSFSGNLKMVYKNFGKGKSSSPNPSVNTTLPNYGSESTMMELQSAIQGAIAHCKRSNYSDVPADPESDFSDCFKQSVSIVSDSFFSQQGYLFLIKISDHESHSSPSWTPSPASHIVILILS